MRLVILKTIRYPCWDFVLFCGVVKQLTTGKERLAAIDQLYHSLRCRLEESDTPAHEAGIIANFLANVTSTMVTQTRERVFRPLRDRTFVKAAKGFPMAKTRGRKKRQDEAIAIWQVAKDLEEEDEESDDDE